MKTESLDILRRLVSFPTVSRDSNLDLIDYAARLLSAKGITTTILPNPEGKKASLVATVGPTGLPGVMLSGHTDVVPVDGQDWTVPPFQMTERDGKLFGRGTADMKGFVACALAGLLRASSMNLKTPLQLVLSYDEEIGCIGVRSLIDTLNSDSVHPLLCIVGEPTSMQVVTGHKGKIEARALCRGREAHSAMAPMALNAIHLGADFVAALREEQRRLVSHGARDDGYDVPYTTVHVGKISAGVALNIVPSLCQIDFEIRNVAGDDVQRILENLRDAAVRIVAEAAAIAPEAAIEIVPINSYPGLDTPPDGVAAALIKSLRGVDRTTKVSFGTEGGLFSRDLGTPTVICGPGSMAQGHKPDEFIEAEQMVSCDAMLEQLLQRLCDGLQ